LETVTREGAESKHLFEEALDTEQMFVVRCVHDERVFDAPVRVPDGRRPLMGVLSMPSPTRLRSGAPLRLVGATEAVPFPEDVSWSGEALPYLTVVPDHRRQLRRRTERRRATPAVRRRRTFLAVAGLCVIGLALPLGGAGGHSHAIGSAPAGTGTGTVEYTVQPGDSLWSIAVRADPTGDPRPLVAQLAAQIGSNTVQPGEHIAVP
jgi:LysM domain